MNELEAIEVEEIKFEDGKCAMMNCYLEEDTPTLKEISEFEECQGKQQAILLMKHYGFKPEDKLCDNCFWK